MEDFTRHMNDDTLTGIFRKVVWDRSALVYAGFSDRFTNVRWVAERDHFHICVSSIYDVLSERTMTMFAAWIVKYITSETKMSKELYDRIKTEIRPNYRKYLRFRKYSCLINADSLSYNVNMLMSEGYVTINDIEDIEFYWISGKTKCIGLCSRFFDVVGVSDELISAPAYVLRYVLYCNILKLRKKDWKILSAKYAKKDQAQQWLKKNLGRGISKESVPYLEDRQ